MNMLSHWNPFRHIAHRDPFGNFEELFRSLGLRDIAPDAGTPPSLRMDVNEDDKQYSVVVDIPGVKKEDIDISIDGNYVAISAQVKRESCKEEGKQLHTERYEGSAFRSFNLPQEVDSSRAEAQYDRGVLTLTLPKKNNGQARKVAVS